MKTCVSVLILMAFSLNCNADGMRLEGFDYPYPVKLFKFSSQKQTLEMAYMDVRPANSNAESVVLLHGKNFCGAYRGETAEALRKKGYRVIIPDQVGFGEILCT